MMTKKALSSISKKKRVTSESTKKSESASETKPTGNRYGLAKGNRNETRRRSNREIWAVDSETDPFKRKRIPRPFIWGAYNGSEYHEFATARELVDFFYERDCIVYAHNGGRFDWHYLREFMEPFTDVLVIAGRMAKFKIGQAEYRDSYNLLPMPLRSGGNKLEIDDYSAFEILERDKPHNRELIRERLRTDCLYLYQMLEKFIADYGLHLTFPGASMHAWSKLSSVEKPETNASFYARFEPYYFGGRVEVFESGIIERPLKLYDINSAYSFAMLSHHPWGTIPYETLTLPNALPKIERSFISIECASRGAFPIRDNRGSLQFPSDGQTRVHNVTGWEYLAALQTGQLQPGAFAIRSVLQLPDSIEFGGYMDNFYRIKVEAKQAGDVFAYECAKRFLCSLYGKFGSNPGNYFEYRLVSPRHLQAAFEDEGWLFACFCGELALVAKPVPEHKARFYNVAVAASITGFVRAYLNRAIRNAKGVVYCDTDCILASDFGALPTDPTALGSWKHEADIDYAAIAGKKMYALRTTQLDASNARLWKTASKGVRLSAADIVRIAKGEIVEYEPEIPQFSFKQGIHFVNRKIKATH